jgi:hypothetical protein
MQTLVITPTNTVETLITNVSINAQTLEVTYHKSEKIGDANQTVVITEKIETCENVKVRDFIRHYIGSSLELVKELPNEIKNEIKEHLKLGKLHLAVWELNAFAMSAKGLKRKDGKSAFNPTENPNVSIKIHRIYTTSKKTGDTFCSFTVEKIKTGAKITHTELKHYSDRTGTSPIVRTFTNDVTDADEAAKSKHICKVSEEFAPVLVTESEFHTFYEGLVAMSAAKHFTNATNGKQSSKDYITGVKETIKLQSKAIQTTAKHINTIEKFDRNFKRVVSKTAKTLNGQNVPTPNISEGVKMSHN